MFCLPLLLLLFLQEATKPETQTLLALQRQSPESTYTTDTLHSKLNCSTYSLTQNPTVNITHIGYNTFGCTAYRSDGMTYQWTSSVGEINTNSSNHGKIKTITAPGLTNGSRLGVSAGNHDFGHYNGTSYDWDPSLSAQETFYP